MSLLAKVLIVWVVVCAVIGVSVWTWRVKHITVAPPLPPVISGQIEGVSTDYKSTVQTPWDVNDPIGSVYKCWDALKAKSPQCGTCVIPKQGMGTLGTGRTNSLSRRSQADANCFVGVS